MAYTGVAKSASPVGVNDVRDGAILGDGFRISVASLLANDVDEDGDALSIIGLDDAFNGELSIEGYPGVPFYQVDIQSSDFIIFTPTATGQGGFTYYLSDGNGHDPETGFAFVQITI
ncbi:MAG TPA: hypothetical protein DD979_14220 [Gammaproteobacteria bacterium]|nr:hypothetical protein [Gammaproteobacteria bacterium]